MKDFEALAEIAETADEEYREFLLEYIRTEGRMDESKDQKIRAYHSVHHRPKLSNLGEMRLRTHLTQTELADKVGVTRWHIGAIENGRREPSVFLALALAEALGTKVEELFYIQPPEPPPTDFDKKTAMVVAKR